MISKLNLISGTLKLYDSYWIVPNEHYGLVTSTCTMPCMFSKISSQSDMPNIMSQRLVAFLHAASTLFSSPSPSARIARQVSWFTPS